MASTNRELLDAVRSAFPQLFTRHDEDGEQVERIDLEKIRQGALPGPGEERDAGLRGAGLGEHLPGAWTLGGMSASAAGAKGA